MWGASSHGDELTGDFANKLDAISIDDRGLFRLSAGKLSHGNLGLLQHNRVSSGREMLTARISGFDPGCVKTPQAEKQGEWTFSDRSKIDRADKF
jgi:hypothetical protein